MAEHDFDRESVDRAFDAMVAGYHLTAESPAETRPVAELAVTEHTAAEEPPSERTPPAGPMVLPRTVPLVPRPRGPESPEPVEAAADDAYVPDPLPPLSRPGAPALVGWTAVLFAAAVVLAAGFGLTLPMWVGWTAVTCFIVGSVVLLTQLPRHRPPEAGDGAVL